MTKKVSQIKITPLDVEIEKYKTSYGDIEFKRDIPIGEKSTFVSIVSNASFVDDEYSPAMTETTFKGLYLYYFATNVELPFYKDENGETQLDIYTASKITDAIMEDPESPSRPPESYIHMRTLVNEKISHKLSVKEHEIITNRFATILKEVGVVVDERITALTNLMSEISDESLVLTETEEKEE